MESSQNQSYIICPVCAGRGKNNFGLACANCGGAGVGAFYDGRFFYWGPKLGRAMIELGHFRKKINAAINGVVFLFGFIGFLCFAFWIYSVSPEAGDISVYAFWRIKHPLLLFFWFSLFADFFVFYRISEDERGQHKIRPASHEERKQKFDLPNNWEELKRFQLRNKIDVSGGFTPVAFEIVEQAYNLASDLGHEYVTPLHIFFACLADKEVSAILSRLNIPCEAFLEKLKVQIVKIPQKKKRTHISKTVQEVLIGAYLSAYALGQKKVSAKNILIPCLEHNHIIRELLLEYETDRDKIFNVILWFIINEKQIESYRRYRRMARFKPGTNMDRAYTSVATPILNQIGYDLTLDAKWGRLEYCVARDKEIEEVWQSFQSGACGVILCGPSGVGKRTVAGGIAQLMVEENVPAFLQDKRLVEVDTARLIGGADAGQAQGRLLAVIDEVVRAGNIVLYISNIESLMGITSGAEESLDLSQVLSGALERRSFYCIASALDTSYVKYLENSALGNVMPKVDIKKPEGNKAIQIIESKIGAFEGKYKIYFSYNAIEEAVLMSEKYIHDKYLPEKAINILEQVAVRVGAERGERALIGKEDVARAISAITNIPITKISEDEGKKLLNLEAEMHKRMIAQEEAVKLVSASLRRARTELRESNRPIANFLFLGPTGVGKTELAKTISEVYFGREEYMIRIDMSEYQHPDSIAKMIGDSDGGRGYLTEQVRKSPFSLVLLDEIEKAHPDILNIFLQVMDDGRLTDGQGRTIDFTNTIIIATSNVGAVYIQDEILKGTDVSIIKQVLINEHLKSIMRPELINRFDGIVVFEPLSLENVVDIARIMLGKIANLLHAKGIGMHIEEGGIRILAKAGFDPKFGARPLRRLLQERIEDEIANKILSGELKRRDTVIIGESAKIAIEKGIPI